MRNLISNRYRNPVTPTPAVPRLKIARVGWLTERDALHVHRIEIASAIGRPLEYAQVLKSIRSPVSQKCVKVDSRIVAFMFVDDRHETTTITRIAVDPCHRRQGYGRLLIDDAARRLSLYKPSLLAELRESTVAANSEAAVAACRFFVKCGFADSHVADRFGADPSWMFVRQWRLWGVA